jgi:hypothetical protein
LADELSTPSSGAFTLSRTRKREDWLRKGGSYFDVVLESDRWCRDGAAWEVRFWREPLTSLCEAIYRAGFLIERLIEPVSAESMCDRWPDDYEKLQRKPGFLHLRLLKQYWTRPGDGPAA